MGREIRGEGRSTKEERGGLTGRLDEVRGGGDRGRATMKGKDRRESHHFVGRGERGKGGGSATVCERGGIIEGHLMHGCRLSVAFACAG